MPAKTAKKSIPNLATAPSAAAVQPARPPVVVIMGHIEAFEYPQASAVALFLLVASFAINGGINFLARWSRRHEQ